MLSEFSDFAMKRMRINTKKERTFKIPVQNVALFSKRQTLSFLKVDTQKLPFLINSKRELGQNNHLYRVLLDGTLGRKALKFVMACGLELFDILCECLWIAIVRH